MTPSQYQAFLRYAKHYYQALRQMNNLHKEGNDAITSALSIFDVEWPNIQHAFQWLLENIREDNKAAILCCYYPDLGVFILRNRQNLQQRMTWLEVAVEAAQIIGDKSMEAIHSGNLGLVYNAIGENRIAA